MPRRIFTIIFWGFLILLLVNALSFMILLSMKHTLYHHPEQPYDYGNWSVVIISIILFTFFFLGYFKPLKKREWRAAGIYEAFIIALFAEMYGFPLTLFFLSSLFGVEISFGHAQGHLLATLISMLGILSLDNAWLLVMVVSNLLIFIGFILLSKGWGKIHGAKGEFVTDGVYSYMRHPQYTGIIVITIGFLIQWPTIITLLMWPILIATYYRLAKREEKELEEKFGEAYREYKRKVPMFSPSIRTKKNIL